MSLSLTTQIVVSYLSGNHVQSADVPALISTVHDALINVGKPAAEPEQSEALKPAVPIRKSVTPDYIVCLEDGKKCKALKRHLAFLGMTPDQYRAKWGLPKDYPMVAPNYAKSRSETALSIWLGRRKAV